VSARRSAFGASSSRPWSTCTRSRRRAAGQPSVAQFAYPGARCSAVSLKHYLEDNSSTRAVALSDLDRVLQAGTTASSASSDRARFPLRRQFQI